MRVHDGITPNRINIDSHGNEIKEIYNDYDFEGDDQLSEINSGVTEIVEENLELKARIKALREERDKSSES